MIGPHHVIMDESSPVGLRCRLVEQGVHGSHCHRVLLSRLSGRCRRVGIEATGSYRLFRPRKSGYSRNSLTAALPQMARSFGASLLCRYGFRRVLLVNGTLTSLACADAIDPYTV